MPKHESPAGKLVADAADRYVHDLHARNDGEYLVIQDQLPRITAQVHQAMWQDALDTMKRQGRLVWEAFREARSEFDKLPWKINDLSGPEAAPFITLLHQKLYVACLDYQSTLKRFAPESVGAIDAAFVLPDGWKDTVGKSPLDAYFTGATRTEARALLSTLEGDATRMESIALSAIDRYVQEQSVHGESWPHSFVNLSSSALLPSEELEVTAGVSLLHWPVLHASVAGKTVPVSESGLARYRLRVPDSAGTYRLPVQISFIDQDGKTETYESTVSYRVLPRPN